jgi:hypothetical protein
MISLWQLKNLGVNFVRRVFVAQKGLYIYCIADIPNDNVSFGKGGIENEEGEIFTINYRDISAIVSEAEIKQYKPTRKNNLVHETNNEKIMNKWNVLPFRFGVVANNKDEILKLLKEKHGSFKELLKTVNNRFEIGVKVFYQNLKDVLSFIGETHPVIIKLKKEKQNLLKNQSMIIDVGRIIEQELNEISLKYKDNIYSKLSSFATKSIISENLSDEMILNASFLIEKNREKDFDSLVCKLDEENGGKLNFKYAGPFPPYSFVKL